jgi:hypothetical protein
MELLDYFQWKPEILKFKNNLTKGVNKWRYPCNRLRGSIKLWDVEAPKFSRQPTHRWWRVISLRRRSLLPSGIYPVVISVGVRGSVVGWGTMLQARRSPVRVPDEVDFSIYLIIPAILWPWSRLSLSLKWVPGIFLGEKAADTSGW